MCVFIAAENVTETLGSNESGTHIETHRLMGRIHMHATEMGSGTKFRKDWFMHSKVIRRDKKTNRLEGILKAYFY